LTSSHRESVGDSYLSDVSPVVLGSEEKMVGKCPASSVEEASYVTTPPATAVAGAPHALRLTHPSTLTHASPIQADITQRRGCFTRATIFRALPGSRSQPTRNILFSKALVGSAYHAPLTQHCLPTSTKASYMDGPSKRRDSSPCWLLTRGWSIQGNCHGSRLLGSPPDTLLRANARRPSSRHGHGQAALRGVEAHVETPRSGHAHVTVDRTSMIHLPSAEGTASQGLPVVFDWAEAGSRCARWALIPGLKALGLRR
jgi:hypothetical protein